MQKKLIELLDNLDEFRNIAFLSSTQIDRCTSTPKYLPKTLLSFLNTSKCSLFSETAGKSDICFHL